MGVTFGGNKNVLELDSDDPQLCKNTLKNHWIVYHSKIN